MSQTIQYPKIIDYTTDPTSNETYLKAFLINDDINQNFWHVPESALKKYASSFIGRPLISHPTADHPDYIAEGVKEASPTFIQDILNLQNKYAIGQIIDVKQENINPNSDKKAYFAYIKMNNPDVLTKLKSGASSSFVSPQIYDLDHSPPGVSTTNFIPLHLAIVNEPAYGDIAKIRGVCNGEGKPCMNALKKAALELVNQIDSNSSFQKNLSNNTYRLSNNNLSQEQVLAQSGYNPIVNTVPHQQVTNEVLSQKTQVQEMDANGNLITKIEDKKPSSKKAVQTEVPTPVQAPAPVVATPPQVVPQPTEVALPDQIVNNMKGMETVINELREKVSNMENFSKEVKEKQLKEASEAQRATIETALSAIQDPNAKQEVVDFFVGLNLADDQLSKLLNLVTKGTFESEPPNPQAVQPQAPTNVRAPVPKKGVKGASYNAIFSNDNSLNNRYTVTGRVRPTDVNLFEGVNFENI